MGVPRFKVLKMDCAQRLAHSALQVLRIFLGTQSERDVFKHRHVRPERKILKYEAEPALLGRQIDPLLPREYAPAVKKDLARVRRLQPGDHAQQRRLAAAGGAEQRGKAAAFDRQVRRLYDLLLLKTLRDPLQTYFHNVPLFCTRDSIAKQCKVIDQQEVKSL